jgi:hypothetical protein
MEGLVAGLTITLEDNGATLLTGVMVDQAALHEVLSKVRNLGVRLLGGNRVEPGLPKVARVVKRYRWRTLR